MPDWAAESAAPAPGDLDRKTDSRQKSRPAKGCVLFELIRVFYGFLGFSRVFLDFLWFPRVFQGFPGFSMVP